MASFRFDPGQPVTVVEVGPRDGLQNEKTPINTAAKIRFIKALAEAGLRRIEATAFVHPKAVPQMADAGEVLAGLDDLPESVELAALVPNMRGWERARAFPLKEAAVFTASSEAFNQKNIGCGIDEAFKRFEDVIPAARADGLRVRGYVSTVFGCPYQGDVAPQAAVDVSLRLFEMGVEEVSLGDTIGVGAPGDVGRALEDVILPALGAERVALHFHDTRGTALSNVLVGLALGVRIFDASAGGLGGCPYAPGAAGNLATEDLVYMLERSGFRTGIDLQKLAAASLALEDELGHALPGRTVATYRQRGLGGAGISC